MLYDLRTLIQSGRKPLYFYKITSSKEKVLIYVLPSIYSLSDTLGFGNGISKPGIYRDSIYCTITPLLNTATEIITTENFVAYFKQVINRKYVTSPNAMFIFDTFTGKILGPYSSASHISKNILLNSSVKSITPNRKKLLFKNIYIFEYAK